MRARVAPGLERRGAVTVLMLITLALVVLSVLSFSQALTDTATMSVARSLAYRRASRAADSALSEVLSRITSSAGAPDDELHTLLTTCRMDKGYRGEHPAVLTRAELGRAGVSVDPVQATLTRLRHYEGFEHDPYRYGILVLEVHVVAIVSGTSRNVEQNTTWVHEFRQGPAAPVAAFSGRPLSLKRFPRDKLEARAMRQKDARDALLQEADRVSRLRAGDLKDKVIGFLADYQRRVAGWRERGRLPDPGNPRWAQIEAARPDSIWGGIGVDPGTFPLEVDGADAGGTPRGWPKLTVPEEVPVYFEWPETGRLTSDEVRPPDLEFPTLETLGDPGWALPRASGRGDFTASAVDWPGTQVVQQGGVTYFPPATDAAGFGLVIEPYRTFRRKVIQLLNDARDAQRDGWKVYDTWVREVAGDDRSTFWMRPWSDLVREFPRVRAAFVYPDLDSFRDCHPAGVLDVFGSEFVAGDELDLTEWRVVRGPGLLAAQRRLVAGPLPRDGTEPVTLLANEELRLTGDIGASLACSDGGATFTDARILGTTTLARLDLEGSGDFAIDRDPGLDAARGRGVVVNVSPAPRVVFDRLGTR